MLHKRLVFPRIQHFSISAAGMSRSQKASSSLKTELLPKGYLRLRIVAILLSILSAVVYFYTSEGAANGIHFRAVVKPVVPWIPCLFQARQMSGAPGVMKFS